MDILTKVFKWHERKTEWWIDQFGISNYQALWFAFIKGMIVILILQWIF